jgi:hypothetical protein
MSDSAEDRTMATAHSVTRWIEQFMQGDREVVQQLWGTLFHAPHPPGRQLVPTRADKELTS